jgi:predicted dehydrogenase
MPDRDFSRRAFLAASAAASAVWTTPKARAQDASGRSPNERLRLGFIGVGNRCQVHLDSAVRLQADQGVIEIAAVCDVFNKNREAAAAKVEAGVGVRPAVTGDFRDILDDESIDAVVIATPDHWHATQTLAALAAGKHVYCEKPMTHTVDEAIAVYRAWQSSDRVMQVGVQSTALPVWRHVNEAINAGRLGKVMQYQTEFFRNSDCGQWRYYELTADMTPKNIDWGMFLGTEFGLAPEMPFDRAVYRQWRCYWPFGSGMFTDLFVHRTTSMLVATGARFPARVVGAGGIFLEYDGRQVPDVATVVADFPEGMQGLVAATMCSAETPIRQLIRGHHASVVFGNGEEFSGYDFVAERPQVTHNSKLKSERVEVGAVENASFAQFKNFVDAARAGDPAAVNCSPELGAAAMITVKLGARSYREGKVLFFDHDAMTVHESDPGWTAGWERMSTERAKPLHAPGWSAGDDGSVLIPPPHQKLAGPWVGGNDPASST